MDEMNSIVELIVGITNQSAANQAHMTKDLRDEFAPGHGELVGIIALGYNAAEEAPKAPKRKADKFVLI